MEYCRLKVEKGWGGGGGVKGGAYMCIYVYAYVCMNELEKNMYVEGEWGENASDTRIIYLSERSG